MKKQLPSILTTAMAVIIFLLSTVYALDQSGIEEKVDRFLQMMQAVALFMGMWNLSRIHSSNIRKKRMNWMFSVWLLVVMFAYAALGIAMTNKNATYRWFYDALITPINATMYATVAFYICSGAYKAFRVKSIEAAIMMASAAWVMLANVPIGEFIWPSTSWLGGMEGVKNWLISVPNSATSRAIGVGTFFGAFATYLRVFLGIERRHLGAG